MIASFDAETLDELCDLPDKKIALFMRTLTWSGTASQEKMERWLLDGDEKLVSLLRKVKTPDAELSISEG